LVKALTCVPGSPTVPACEQPLRRGATLAAGRALDHAHGVVAMVVPGCWSRLSRRVQRPLIVWWKMLGL